MNRFLANFLKYKDLLYELVLRDIKIKYRRSILGMFWSLLNPLLMMIVLTIVFSHLFRFDIKNYPIYLLTGQIMFTFFSESTSSAMRAIIDNASLIKKVYIPKYIFPVSKVLSSFFNLIFSLLAIILVTIGMILLGNNVNLTWTFLLFPVPLIFILTFSIGIGLILSCYAVFFRDLIHLYSVGLTAWMYLTPIFYPVSIIPQKYLILIKLNPMYYFVEYFRKITFYGTLPTLKETLICILIDVIFLIIGLLVFYRKQNKFILHV